MSAKERKRKEIHEKNGGSGCQWLMPVILDTWEAKIGKMVI
jgi:hypothetical protein